MSKYLEHSKYLPKLNNERPNERNSIYKERFTSLHNLILVMVAPPKPINDPWDSTQFLNKIVGWLDHK